MPTNTFEHLGTTTISGTSTNQVQFTGLSSYERIMIIAGGAATTSGNGLYGILNSSGSVNYNSFAATSTSSGNAVPVGNLASSQPYAYFHSPITYGDSGNFALHATIFKDGNGYIHVSGKFGQWNSSSGGQYRFSTAYKAANLTSFTLFMDPGYFTDGSVISAYGMV